MKKKNYFYITSVIFLIVGLVHLLKIFLGFEIKIDDITYPLWLSWAEVIFAFYLSFVGFKLGMKSDNIK